MVQPGDSQTSPLPEHWWRDAELLRAQYEKHGTLEAVSRAHGISDRSLKHWWKRLGLPPLPPGPKPSVVKAAAGDGDAWLLDVLKSEGDSATVEELADAADVSPRRVREALERLGHGGYRLAEEDDARIVLRRVPVPSDTVHRALFAGEEIRLGIVSDTHLGSKHCRLDELHMAYKLLEDEGIETVLHPGDLVCGTGIYPGQINDIDLHTLEAQIDFAAENYPRFKGRTLLIGGNHDLEGAFGKVGANPALAVANQRDDIDYLGDYRATIELEQGTRLYLLHPKGGMGYSADYKVRKLAEGFESGTKPNACFIGHFHRRGDFEARGIQMLLCGCFESGGSLGPRLGLLDPAVGFHIVTMRIGDDGSIVKWESAWHRFWPGREVELAA